jgi:Flp pilus assembly protein TadG
MSFPMISRTIAHERAAVSGRSSVPVPDVGAPTDNGAPGPRRMRGEEGLAAFVVCIPAFFLAVLLAIQFALWSHASHLARAAAEQGASTAAAYGSTPAAGTAAAYQFIAATGPSSLTRPHVTTTTGTGNTVQVTISGRAQSLIPWLSMGVSSTSVEPIQQFRASG